MLVAACASNPSHRPSHRVTPPSRSEPSVLPTRSAAQPDGTISLEHDGVGPSSLSLRLASTSPAITIRMACWGTGKSADVVNARGISELHIAGCTSPRVIYTSGFTGSAPDSRLRVAVSAATHWSIVIWQA